MSIILFLFFALSVFAQEFQYRIEGSFQTYSAPGTPGLPDTVNYLISWNETSTTIQGIYRDNYFSQYGPNIVTGTVQANGRTMNVVLPQAVNGVRLVRITMTQLGTASGNIPVSIVTQDNIGRTIDAPNNFALMTAMQAATTPPGNANDSCTTGFGALTGFCGIYNGDFNEAADTGNRCSLLTAGNPRLELGTDTVFRLYLNYLPGAPTQSSHTLGTFTPSPQTTAVNITSRYCANLPATEFLSGNCKTLNFVGNFGNNAGVYNFVGTYTITDEVTTESCSYNMSLTREITL